MVRGVTDVHPRVGQLVESHVIRGKCDGFGRVRPRKHVNTTFPDHISYILVIGEKEMVIGKRKDCHIVVLLLEYSVRSKEEG